MCGKAYVVILQNRANDSDVPPRLFTVAQAMEWARAEYDRRARMRNLSEREEQSFKAFLDGSESRWMRDFTSRAFSQIAERLSKFRVSAALHIHFQSPILLVRGEPRYRWRNDPSSPITVWKNPRLADSGFISVMDPFTAFQEISVYLSNVLTNIERSEPTTGGDQVVLTQKGFDPVTSFRQGAPGQKKLNRAQNRARKKGIS
ncbi:MAG TPA: hypothetical protein VG944_06190 [Fimbriimonas sp.]|nr:hypothetical protein [Fimbriimonas sp.]